MKEWRWQEARSFFEVVPLALKFLLDCGKKDDKYEVILVNTQNSPYLFRLRWRCLFIDLNFDYISSGPHSRLHQVFTNACTLSFHVCTENIFISLKNNSVSSVIKKKLYEINSQQVSSKHKNRSFRSNSKNTRTDHSKATCSPSTFTRRSPCHIVTFYFLFSLKYTQQKLSIPDVCE